MPTFDLSVTDTLTLSQTPAKANTLFNLSPQSNLFPLQNCVGNNSQFLDAYGTLIEANLYFDNRLRSTPWKRAKNDDKKAAMREATLMIDRLNYAGNKTDPAQVHQFPRGPQPLPTQIIVNESGIPVSLQTTQDDADSVIPTDIKYACFEIAMKLIQGYDPDREADLLSTESHSYSGVRTTFKRDFIPDYMRAGIPSFRAWSYLKPFLRDPGECFLTRV
jgi:hypothetical protein